MKSPTVYGVGIVDVPTVNPDKTRKQSYLTWKGIIRRCYSDENQRHPNYVGCSVCKEWLTFSKFEKWYNAKHKTDYAIDKDILVSGNKTYGPKTCTFVPVAINSLLTARERLRGPYPQGVTSAVRNGKLVYLVATLHRYGKMHAIAWGQDPAVLHEAYKKAKAEHIREVARSSYAKREISKPVFCALLRIARDFSFIKE